jgi:hypothetical protein
MSAGGDDGCDGRGGGRPDRPPPCPSPVEVVRGVLSRSRIPSRRTRYAPRGTQRGCQGAQPRPKEGAATQPPEISGTAVPPPPRRPRTGATGNPSPLAAALRGRRRRGWGGGRRVRGRRGRSDHGASGVGGGAGRPPARYTAAVGAVVAVRRGDIGLSSSMSAIRRGGSSSY